MKLYDIFLFILIIGAVSEGFNTSGMFDVTVPTSRTALDGTQVVEVSEAVENEGINAFTAVSLLLLMIRMLIAAFIAVCTIIPLGMSWGFPAWALLMIQVPIWGVEMFGFYQLVTGHTAGGME